MSHHMTKQDLTSNMKGSEEVNSDIINRSLVVEENSSSINMITLRSHV